MDRENGATSPADGERTTRVGLLWATAIGILALFLLAVGVSFFAPEVLLTDAGRGLSGEARVEAENAVRSGIIQVGGSIVVIGTLALAAWRLMLTDHQLRSMEISAKAAAENARAALDSVQHQRERSHRDEQGRWEDKLRDAYADWAAALFYAAIIDCDIGDAKKLGDHEKLRRAKEAFYDKHFRAETIMLRILMMEKRSSLISAMKRIDSEKMPHMMFPPELHGVLWENLDRDAQLYRDVVGSFLGLMRRRLERLSDLVTDPDLKDFSLPDGEDYRAYVRGELGKRDPRWPSSAAAD